MLGHKTEIKESVEGNERKCAIGRTAAKSSADRYCLVQVNPNAADRGMMSTQQLPGAATKISACISRNISACDGETKYVIRRRKNLESIVQRKWEKDRFQIMVTVVSFAGDSKAEIYLTIRKNNQRGRF